MKRLGFLTYYMIFYILQYDFVVLFIKALVVLLNLFLSILLFLLQLKGISSYILIFRKLLLIKRQYLRLIIPQITIYSQVWYYRADMEYKTGVYQGIVK